MHSLVARYIHTQYSTSIDSTVHIILVRKNNNDNGLLIYHKSFRRTKTQCPCMRYPHIMQTGLHKYRYINNSCTRKQKHGPPRSLGSPLKTGKFLAHIFTDITVHPMTLRYIQWHYGISDDITVHPLTVLYIQWPYGITNDLTVHPMTLRYNPLTVLYIQWPYGTFNDLTVYPMTSRYIQWPQGTSINSTVYPMTSRYIQWHHGTSNDLTVHPLTVLYIQW